jgi:hypothetical protein
LKLSIWSCDSPDFLITPGIRILGTGADTLNSVQASYFERFHWPILNFWTLQNVEHGGNGTRFYQNPSIRQTFQYKLPHFQQNNMRKLANIARRVFGNLVQASYFERFHWSILNFWTLQTAEHAVPCSVAVMLHGKCIKTHESSPKSFK